MTTIEFNIGDGAPCNSKAAIASPANLCFACGRKLGKNPSYFEVNTSWELIATGSDEENSQGCFPIGSECAKKFSPSVLWTPSKVGA